MCKGKVTLLRNLNEGDKFYFCDQNGRIKNSATAYFVEGQYPKFKCTTVFAEKNINHYFSGKNSDVNCHNVTGVENNQYVKIEECNVLHVHHTLSWGHDNDEYC